MKNYAKPMVALLMATVIMVPGSVAFADRMAGVNGNYDTETGEWVPFEGYDTNGNPVNTNVEGYTVSYDANGGEDGSVPRDGNADGLNVYTKGEQVKVLFNAIPKREGYVFVGWDENKDVKPSRCTYKVNSVKKTISNISKDIVLYAIWQKEKTVSYEQDEDEVIYKTEYDDPKETGKAISQGRFTYTPDNGGRPVIIDSKDIQYLYDKVTEVENIENSNTVDSNNADEKINKRINTLNTALYSYDESSNTITFMPNNSKNRNN